MYSPTLEEIKSRRNEGNLVPIYREIVADLETPVSAFLKISHGGRSFLLESVEGGQWLARYSFIGTDPYLVVSSSGRAGADPLRRSPRNWRSTRSYPSRACPASPAARSAIFHTRPRRGLRTCRRPSATP